MRIHLLDSEVINQIRAGEVVERPASVIKELIENSLDAGATSLSIHISNSGLSLIRVHDDGEGILKEDLSLCLQSHTTSKITTLSDLDQVASFGFRGEALASIASVSQIKILSRESSSEYAWEVRAQEGKIEGPIPSPLINGTVIEVQNLFYNTPVRKRFMKSARTEFFHIERLLERFLLATFNVGIALTHNDKKLWQLPIANTVEQKEERLEKILGKDFKEAAFYFSAEVNEIAVYGWAAEPRYHRAQADQQYFYINGRFVKDKMLTQAVREAYRDVMYGNRYPAVVLYLEMNPHDVNVNVHPTKLEVRFKNSQQVYIAVFQTLQKFIKERHPKNSVLHTPSLKTSMETHTIPPVSHSLPPSRTYFPSEHLKKTISQEDKKAATAFLETVLTLEEKIPEQTMLEAAPSLGKALAQVHGIYIVAQNEKGLILVDMHAAHERILYEKLKRQFNQGTIKSQGLLVPIQLSLTSAEVDCLENHCSDLNKLGFQIELSGPDMAIVREMPAIIKSQSVEILLRDLLSELITFESSSSIEEHLHSILGNMACKNALKAHHRLTLSEMDALLREMENTDNSGYCNHGRPTWIQFTHSELDAFFLRGR